MLCTIMVDGAVWIHFPYRLTQFQAQKKSTYNLKAINVVREYASLLCIYMLRLSSSCKYFVSLDLGYFKHVLVRKITM